MTEICSIIHKCTIHGEKNYMNLDFSSPLSTPINVPLDLSIKLDEKKKYRRIILKEMCISG